jgi:hypothetical protein
MGNWLNHIILTLLYKPCKQEGKARKAKKGGRPPLYPHPPISVSKTGYWLFQEQGQREILLDWKQIFGIN